MIKNIAKGYLKFASVVGKILLLCAFCLGLGFVVVYPLWKWASTSPDSYTWVLLTLIAAAFIYLIVSQLRKKGPARFFFGLAKLTVILGGLSLCVFFVLKGNRIASLVVFVLIFVVYGILTSISNSVLKSSIEKHE